jgi:hypothetical protein
VALGGYFPVGRVGIISLVSLQLAAAQIVPALSWFSLLAYRKLTYYKEIQPEPLLKTGTGVICETRALPGAVIPAKAGIQSASHWKCGADGLDSRFRGNDECFEGDPIPNDTSTRK